MLPLVLLQIKENSVEKDKLHVMPHFAVQHRLVQKILAINVQLQHLLFNNVLLLDILQPMVLHVLLAQLVSSVLLELVK